MTSLWLRRAASVGVGVVMASSVLLVPSTAEAAPLKCRASVSKAKPKQYSNVFVRIRTAPRAKVRTVAHYKTTKTTKYRRANAKGWARTKYYISGATPGYRVKVTVRVTKKARSRTCTTSFKPRR